MCGLAHHWKRQPRYRRQVRFDAHNTTSINNRFAPLPGLLTDAVFNVDDDMARPRSLAPARSCIARQGGQRRRAAAIALREAAPHILRR